MGNEIVFRHITSLLVLGSLPPLFLLLKELYFAHATTRKSDTIQFVLLIIYATFLISGLLTLYINIQIIFFSGATNQYTHIALLRNIIKQVGILFVSWRLYLITREGGRTK